MFTFVVWAIGLGMLVALARMNLEILVICFEEHWLLGIIVLGLSVFLWIGVLSVIL